jgi:hypothetical protein
MLRLAVLLLTSIIGGLPGSSFLVSCLTVSRSCNQVCYRSYSKLAMVATQSSSNNNKQIPIDALYEPTKRDAVYGTNVAQYLVDLHDNKATFDFCGGMLFQLVLSEKLRNHLVQVAASPKDGDQQPVVFDANKPRMHMIPNYSQSEPADEIRLFHGREIRQVPWAAGGMGMVLQVSHSGTDSSDPEGWTRPEVDGYDGWGHDAGRTWRNGNQLESEGYGNFRKQFGSQAFTLNHRFYLHLDKDNRMWLSAEDGCEGTPASKALPKRFNMFGLF